MKINSINQQTSFKRVVHVESITNPFSVDIHSNKVDKSTIEVAKVLNNKPCNTYSDEEKKKIRRFFKDSLKDYNGKNKVIFRRAEGDLYLISGQDTKDIEKLEKEKHEERIKLKNDDSEKSSNIKKILIDNTFIAIEEEIVKRAENNEEGKPYSSFTLGSSNAPSDTRMGLPVVYLAGRAQLEVKLDKFNYSSFYLEKSNDPIFKYKGKTVEKSLDITQ